METLLRKQRSKYTNPDGSKVAVSNLWFTVSGKIWKIEPSPEQTLKTVFTNGAPRLLYFSYIWFDLRNSRTRMALRQDYRQCKSFFWVCFSDSITLFKKLIGKKVSHLQTCSLIEGLSIDEPTSLYFFLFQKSFNAHARCTRKCFCTTRNKFLVTDWPLTKAIVVRRELRSCTCSWGHDVWFTDRRHLLQQTFKEKLRRRNYP